jgi:hypothetical protein
LWPVAALAARDGKSVVVIAQKVNFANFVASGSLAEGTVAIVFPNVVQHEDPREWQYTVHELGTSAWNWFSGISFADPDPGSENDLVYLWGHFGVIDRSDTYLARGRFSDMIVGNFSGLEYWSRLPESSYIPGWESSLAHENMLPIGLPSWEATFTWSETLGLWYNFYLNCADPKTGRAIFMYTAREVTGPWQAVKVYDLPDHLAELTSSFICYAAKAHPEMQSSPASFNGTVELVLSYICNQVGGNDKLFGPQTMDLPQREYWPEFLGLSVPVDLAAKHY